MFGGGSVCEYLEVWVHNMSHVNVMVLLIFRREKQWTQMELLKMPKDSAFAIFRLGNQ